MTCFTEDVFVQQTTTDYLQDELGEDFGPDGLLATGLPETYTPTEIQERAESVFLHMVCKYPELPSPAYGAVS